MAKQKNTKNTDIVKAIKAASREIHAGVGGRAGAHSSQKGAKGFSRKTKHRNRRDW